MQQEYEVSISEGEAYKTFRASVARRVLPCGWTFYQCGDREAEEAVVFLHGTSATAEQWFFQLMSLSARGYRCVSLEIPAVEDFAGAVRGLTQCFRELNLKHAHVAGVSLGGLLALKFACARPQLVDSLFLVNAFCDTSLFHEASLAPSLFAWMPAFMLRSRVLDNFPTPEQLAADGADAMIAGAVDFCIQQIERLSQEQLASRLQLNSALLRIGELPRRFDGRTMTVLSPEDRVSLPRHMRKQVEELCEKAGGRVVSIKSGGDFPMLSRHEELSMHLLVHLRRVQQRSSESAESASTEDTEDTENNEDTEDTHVSPVPLPANVNTHSRDKELADL